MGTLYIVATPIGNLGDLTYRALESLKKVDVIACEDTRHTLKLLNWYNIKKKLISCRAFNENKASEKIIALLKEGKDIAYVSDAGTPGISDPGRRLAGNVRKEGYNIVPIPGVSAFTTLLSVSGFFGSSVLFEGFLGIKQGKRKKRLMELLDYGFPFLLYESPHRILKLLDELHELDAERMIMIGREMTKKYEEYIEGKADQLAKQLVQEKKVKGEFSVLVSGKKKS